MGEWFQGGSIPPHPLTQINNQYQFKTRKYGSYNGDSR